MRHSFYFLAILGFNFFVACTSNRPQKPDNLISIEKMANIIQDIYILNATKSTNKKPLETNHIVPETYILQKYSIDSAQFAKSNAYYSYDIETYSKIIETVKSRLEIKKTHFDSLKKRDMEEKKRLRDSLKKEKIKLSGDSIVLDSLPLIPKKTKKIQAIKNMSQIKFQDSLLKSARHKTQY